MFVSKEEIYLVYNSGDVRFRPGDVRTEGATRQAFRARVTLVPELEALKWFKQIHQFTTTT